MLSFPKRSLIRSIERSTSSSFELSSLVSSNNENWRVSVSVNPNTRIPTERRGFTMPPCLFIRSIPAASIVLVVQLGCSRRHCISFTCKSRVRRCTCTPLAKNPHLRSEAVTSSVSFKSTLCNSCISVISSAPVVERPMLFGGVTASNLSTGEFSSPFAYSQRVRPCLRIDFSRITGSAAAISPTVNIPSERSLFSELLPIPIISLIGSFHSISL